MPVSAEASLLDGNHSEQVSKVADSKKGKWLWSNANDLACDVRPLKPCRPVNWVYKRLLDSNSYWVDLDAYSTWLSKMRFNTKVRNPMPKFKNGMN